MHIKNAIALGTFDGIHKGHRAVLELPYEFKKIAVTFITPPKSVMSGENSAITLSEDKCRILKKIGIDEVFMLDFKKVENLSAEEFLEFLNNKYKPAFLSCGFNYRFGKNGAGDTSLLEKYCNEKGIILKCVPAVTENGMIISSTNIRKLLQNGETEEANKLLCEPFSFETEVISGEQRGRTIGFPTINQKYPQELLKIKSGAYFTKVLFDGKTYSGITNIGIRPTYKTDYVISETYIIDFNADLYGKTVRIIPQRFLREEKKFSSVENLRKQIAADLKYVKEIENGS